MPMQYCPGCGTRLNARSSRDPMSLMGFAERAEKEMKRKPKRKLSAWNKYVKANSNKPRFRLRSGKINLKKMGVAFRKTPAGKKKRR